MSQARARARTNARVGVGVGVGPGLAEACLPMWAKALIIITYFIVLPQNLEKTHMTKV